MDKIGTREQFKTGRCFELYLYAVEIGKKVNKLIKDGYHIVFDEGLDGDCEKIEGIIFYGDGLPCVCVNYGCDVAMFDWYLDDDLKTAWLEDVTMKDIEDSFKLIKAYEPKEINLLEGM